MVVVFLVSHVFSFEANQKGEHTHLDFWPSFIEGFSSFYTKPDFQIPTKNKDFWQNFL